MSLDLQLISVLINDTRELMVKEDRRQAGSDLAVTLHQCEHALGLCQTEIERLRAELAEAKAEPVRPVAMLWTDATVWHAYERYEDADRDRCQAVKEPPLMVVKEWTWHPKSP